MNCDSDSKANSKILHSALRGMSHGVPARNRRLCVIAFLIIALALLFYLSNGEYSSKASNATTYAKKSLGFPFVPSRQSSTVSINSVIESISSAACRSEEYNVKSSLMSPDPPVFVIWADEELSKEQLSIVLQKGCEVLIYTSRRNKESKLNNHNTDKRVRLVIAESPFRATNVESQIMLLKNAIGSSRKIAALTIFPSSTLSISLIGQILVSLDDFFKWGLISSVYIHCSEYDEYCHTAKEEAVEDILCNHYDFVLKGVETPYASLPPSNIPYSTPTMRLFAHERQRHLMHINGIITRAFVEHGDIVIPFQMSVFRAEVDTWVSGSIIKRGFWQNSLVKSMGKFGVLDKCVEYEQLYKEGKAIGKRPLFVDIGANVGYFGFSAAALGCDVIMFEMQNDITAMLYETAALNPTLFRGRVKIIQGAISSNEDKYSSYTPHDTNKGMTKVSHGESSSSDENSSIQVPNIRLDEHISRPAIFVKMDIEASEIHAFQTGKNFWTTHKAKFGVTEIRHTQNDVIDILEKFGYQMYTNPSLTEPKSVSEMKEYIAPLKGMRIRDIYFTSN
eukprot:Nk52_evm21s684 gene=Nk52_evmTU21s684